MRRHFKTWRFTLLTAGLVLAASTVSASARAPWKHIWSNNSSSVVKVCDEGRAIYVLERYNVAGITVVADAPECRFTKRPDQ